MKRLLSTFAPVLLVAVTLLLLHYHFPRFPSPNEYSRVYLLDALVHESALNIDGPLGRHFDMEDKLEVAGQTYSNKPPGLALLALPAYAIAHTIAHAADREHQRL